MDDRGHSGKTHIAIIGAGFSGLSVAHYLRKYTNLQSFIIYEKSERTQGGAGTWKDNTYPGCACDVPIHLYQLSWAKHSDWTEYLPLQSEIQDYLNATTRDHGIYRHIQFSTELVNAKWNKDEGVWECTLRNLAADDPENATYTVKHHAVIMATGPLSQPKMPENMNVEAFKGVQFHSQSWRHDISLEGKRVAVVGNGCSATQFLPIISHRCKSLTQYISSPQWYVPRDNPLYTDTQRWLFKYIPGLAYAYRLRLAWNWESEAYKLKGGDGPAKVRKGVEDFFLSHMHTTAPAKYHKQLTPNYPLGCKRLVFDSNYFQTLHNPNVHLKFTRVESVYENGLIGKDGSREEYDVIIWATGFTATMPFYDTKIIGSDGIEMHDRWRKQGAPSAYAGLMYPNVPNFYMTTGPNTLSGHYSVTTIIEIQAQYIAQMIKYQLENDVKSFEVTQEAHNDYNSWIKELMKGRVWTDSACNSWFKTKDGLIPTNFPGTTMLYWSKTFYPNMSHMKQTGGKRKVYGHSIQKDVGKIILRSFGAAVLIYYLRHNSHSIYTHTQDMIGVVAQKIDTLIQFVKGLVA